MISLAINHPVLTNVEDFLKRRAHEANLTPNGSHFPCLVTWQKARLFQIQLMNRTQPTPQLGQHNNFDLVIAWILEIISTIRFKICIIFLDSTLYITNEGLFLLQMER